MHVTPVPTASYLYIVSLDPPGLAWEYLRRNDGYCNDWQHHGLGQNVRVAEPWGLRFLEDPHLDARDADPDWLPDPDALVAYGPAVRDDDDPFSLWAIPGRKSIVHDGKRLLLKTRAGRRIVRLAVSLALGEGMPFAFAVGAGRNRRAHAAAIEVADALAGVEPPTRGSPVPRTMLVHMRAVQALDAANAGLSEREIAGVVLDRGERDGEWNDSAARAQVRYLLRHGRALRDGGYRQLLRADPERAPRR